MIRKTRLFTPGPTPLLPAAQFAMAAADIHHRTAEFRALYTRVLAQLKDFVGTKNDVLILASSGSGAMDQPAPAPLRRGAFVESGYPGAAPGLPTNVALL